MRVPFDPFKESFDSLEKLADVIGTVLARPITIEDAHHRLLSYSSHDQETDPARISTIIGRRVPEKVINSLWKHGVMQRLANSAEPVRVSAIDAVGLGNRVAISVRKDGEILGYIWVIEEQQRLDEDQILHLQQAAKAVSRKLLQLRISRIKEEEEQREFVWQILTGHLQSHEKIKVKAEQLKLTLASAFCVIVFQFQDDISTKDDEQTVYVMNTTQRLRVIFSVYESNQLIVMVGPRAKEELTWQHGTEFVKTVILQMKERFHMGQLIGGVGGIYQSYDQIATSYQEALTVIRIKQQFPFETQDVFDYQRLGFYRFLPIIMEQIAAEDHPNLSLQKLHEYDEKHQTQLLESLEVFLNHDSNTKAAASALHVHINTLLYRLKRISEIGDIDLNNPDQKFSLYLDLKIAKSDHH